MRLVEFTEQLPALINKTADVDGILVSINTNKANASVYATSNGRRLGYAEFDRDDNVLVPYDLAVDDKYRGQGIAAVMYDYVKSLGFKIKASAEQTDAGKYFWSKNRGSQRVWEDKTLDPDLYGEELPRATVKKIVTNIMQQVDPAAKVKVGYDWGYYLVATDNDMLKFDFGITADGGEISANIVNAYSSYKGAGVVTRIIAECFKAAEQLWGKPTKFVISTQQDRGDGAWQAIAQKLGAEWGGSAMESVNEARIPRSIEEFLDSLSPDDVGVEDFGTYRVHFEGFTDDCQSSSDYRKNPEAVYQQVFNDFIQREGGRKPVVQDITGDEDYPILYSIFKIPQQVKEISRLPKKDAGDFGDKGTIVAPTHAVKKTPLPGGSKFTYAVNKTGTGDIEIMIFDGETLAAEMDLFDTQDFMKTWRVETVVVDPDYRGKGLGKALYGIALSILKLTVEAGETQTQHGQQMWLMLNSIPGVEVVGYNMEPTDKYQPKLGDKVVDQNTDWTRYTFPVKAGSRSMRSGRRGTGIYTSQASMIAKWTGQ